MKKILLGLSVAISFSFLQGDDKIVTGSMLFDDVKSTVGSVVRSVGVFKNLPDNFKKLGQKINCISDSKATGCSCETDAKCFASALIMLDDFIAQLSEALIGKVVQEGAGLKFVKQGVVMSLTDLIQSAIAYKKKTTKAAASPAMQGFISTLGVNALRIQSVTEDVIPMVTFALDPIGSAAAVSPAQQAIINSEPVTVNKGDISELDL